MKNHMAAGEPTGFKEAFLSGRKIHTIRLNEKDYFKSGDTLSIRQWKDKPYASKQVEIGVRTIHIEPIIMVAGNGKMHSCNIPEGQGNDINVDWTDLAANDGLDSSDFFDWFFPNGNGIFTGDILHFTDFRYNNATKG